MNNLTYREIKEWVKRNSEEGLFFDIEHDEQYFYLMGQVVVFIIRNADNELMANEMQRNVFLNCGNEKYLKSFIMRYLTVTCSHVSARHELAFNRALGAVLGWYQDNKKGSYNNYFIVGYTAGNLLDKYAKVYEIEQ
ncbi:hypothetical protein [Candidatus Clostridium radicumherbarum]|uniref:Uncharacterized protein n=1 Tax=Candidatus Clostridium radicumherbarum TaxID=3381662 RepID=A0ABW8TY82_9CLOT